MLGRVAECKQTNRALAVSMRETVDICFDPPVCLELPGNWEDTFFREVAYERGEETNAAGEKGGSEDEIDEPNSFIHLACKTFAFSSDKMHYENRK